MVRANAPDGKEISMAISIRHKVDAANLEVTDTPSPEHLHEWWSMLTGDPEDIAVAYADGFPNSLDAFLQRVENGTYYHFHLIMHGDDVAGSFWLHDALIEDGVMIGGWLGGYIMPAYRSSAFATARTVLNCVAAKGIQHLFSAVHEQNRPSRLYNHKILKFHQVGKYPGLLRYGGKPATMVLYAQHRADTELAWEEATKRHQRILSLN
jgi:hypothetical protein